MRLLLSRTKANGLGVFEALILLATGMLWLQNWGSIPNPTECLFFGIAIAITGVLLLTCLTFLERRRYATLRMVDVDSMSGPEFEQYVEKLLEHRRFHVRRIGGAGDLGVDLIAQTANRSFAVQVKRHKENISRRAVSDAVAGQLYHGCDSAMVITNSYFTPGAKVLAKSTHCELIARDILADWISDYATTMK